MTELDRAFLEVDNVPETAKNYGVIAALAYCNVYYGFR
jgi:hypothetical protein